MKKKRTFITLAVLIAVLVLGVGYAAVSKNLVITGTLNATVDTSNFVVEFTKAENAVNLTGTPSASGTSATFVVDGSKMKTKGDTASVVFTITNNTTDTVNLSAQLSDAVIDQIDNSKFTVTASDLSGEVLAPGDTATTTVTVTLKETPIEAISNETVTVTYTATAVQPTA